MHEYQVIEAFVTDELAPFCQNRQMVRCSVLQCVAVCCSVLQCVCSVLTKGRQLVRGQPLTVTVVSYCWNPTSFEMEDFPINKLRWIAVAAAVTHLVMYVDVDFIPSTAARDHILSFYQKSAHVVEQDMMSHVVKEHNILHLVEEEPSHAKIHEGRAKIHEGPSRSVDDTEHVLVLPCFVTNGVCSVWCCVVQCGQVWCSVLPCFVTNGVCCVWCSVLQCGEVCCSVLPCFMGARHADSVTVAFSLFLKRTNTECVRLCVCMCICVYVYHDCTCSYIRLY